MSSNAVSALGFMSVSAKVVIHVLQSFEQCDQSSIVLIIDYHCCFGGNRVPQDGTEM